jgi:hypothetical protein
VQQKCHFHYAITRHSPSAETGAEGALMSARVNVVLNQLKNSSGTINVKIRARLNEFVKDATR